MREKIQWATAFSANAVIFSNDLVESVVETFSFLMGLLL